MTFYFRLVTLQRYSIALRPGKYGKGSQEGPWL